MLNEEKIVREVVAMWRDGLESTKESWRQYGSDDLVWWNSARGGVIGLHVCLAAIDHMFQGLQIAYVDVPIRSVVAEPGRVIVERSDDMYRSDGSVIAHVPVTGVIEFAGDKITAWRDYCDDWMLKMQTGDEHPSTAP